MYQINVLVNNITRIITIATIGIATVKLLTFLTESQRIRREEIFLPKKIEDRIAEAVEQRVMQLEAKIERMEGKIKHLEEMNRMRLNLNVREVEFEEVDK